MLSVQVKFLKDLSEKENWDDVCAKMTSIAAHVLVDTQFRYVNLYKLHVHYTYLAQKKIVYFNHTITTKKSSLCFL